MEPGTHKEESGAGKFSLHSLNRRVFFPSRYEPLISGRLVDLGWRGRRHNYKNAHTHRETTRQEKSAACRKCTVLAPVWRRKGGGGGGVCPIRPCLGRDFSLFDVLDLLIQTGDEGTSELKVFLKLRNHVSRNSFRRGVWRGDILPTVVGQGICTQTLIFQS